MSLKVRDTNGTLLDIANQAIVDDVLSSTSTNAISNRVVTNALNNKVDEPSSEGTSGQVLTTDGAGNRSWTTVNTDTYTAGYGIDITNGVIASKTFVGTTAQWNALSPTQQAAYTYVNITDDNGPSDELGLSVVSGAICVTYNDSNS